MSANDDFKIIYKILNMLEKALDIEEFDVKSIYTSLKDEISKNKFNQILLMLYESEYINGTIANGMEGKILINYRITLKGLEYLAENTIMKRIYNSIKGITDIIK